jgi:hypothetical protein
MPQIVIVTDRGDSAEEVVYRERVDAIHFDSEHSRAQLAERLAWAIGDAAQNERRQQTRRSRRGRKLEEVRVA